MPSWKLLFPLTSLRISNPSNCNTKTQKEIPAAFNAFLCPFTDSLHSKGKAPSNIRSKEGT